MKLVRYIKEAYNELKNKVTWPSWTELQSSAIIVMVASAIIALLILAMDETFKVLMEFFYGNL